MRTALLVVDMQNGFVNHNSDHIVPNVLRLLDEGHWEDIVFTRFLNTPESAYVRWIGWSRLMAAPETEIIAALQPLARTVVDKHGYTALVPLVIARLKERSIERVVICGVASDGCVLKTAVDAFECSIEPVVVTDACASHAGATVHEAALMLIPRFIGREHMRTTDSVLGESEASGKAR